MAGLTPQGFEPKRLSTIITEMRQDAQDRFGPDINTNEDSVLGMLIDIISFQLASEWELAESVYSAYIPSSAEGVQLDNIASINGVYRQGAVESTCPVTLYGEINTVIPAGTIVEAPLSHDQFGTEAVATLDSTTSCSFLEVECPTPTSAAESFTININGNAITVTGETVADDVAAAFVTGIAANSNLDDLCTATSTLDKVSITSFDGTTASVSTFAATITTNLSVTKVGLPIGCRATVTGPIAAPIDTIKEVVTPVGGLDAVCKNFQSAIVGRNYETDTELRIRRLQGVTTAGSATVDAITANLLQVQDVGFAQVTENVTGNPVGGIPGHSFLSVVQGGTDTAVAQKIWDVKPAGIQAYGQQLVQAVDSEGVFHTVGFCRPNPVPITVSVVYKLNPEESFPENGETAMQEVIVAYGDTLGIGIDVIAQRFVGPIYAAITGIENLAITVSPSADGGETSTIAADEYPTFSEGNVTVTEAP